MDQAQAFERFKKDGRNSSHFVWYLAGLSFYETRNGWIFAYQKIRDVTLLALEPLAPSEHVDDPYSEGGFATAWAEFSESIGPGVTAFVSVYSPFAKLLVKFGFRALKVGEEPWVDLSDCIPKGNAGKGVRSARNQAIHAGLAVEEWRPEELEASPAKRAVLAEIFGEWKDHRIVHLSGFMNAVDPFAYMAIRRYFVLKAPDGRVEAFLIATPVPALQSYFLEDMIIRPTAPRGTGELLTLEAMVALRDSGAKQASLGVISIASIAPADCRASGLPALVRFVLVTAPRYLRPFYNFDGTETYRKRFKPQAWNNVHICVHSGAGISDTRAWFKVLWALLLAFKPKLQLSGRWFWNAFSKPFRRYPTTMGAALLTFSSFAFVNHFGRIPEWALTRFGFSGSAPWQEWPLRSLTSDFLFFDKGHFLTWGAAYVAALYWAERTQRRSFVLCFAAAVSLFDDFIDYAVLVKPFQYFQPHVFENIIRMKDVGTSLGLAALLGLQVCQFRRLREPLFALGMMGMILGFAFSSAAMHLLVRELDHVLFFMLGYLVGKLRFELARARSRRVAKGKPPTGRAVRGDKRPGTPGQAA